MREWITDGVNGLLVNAADEQALAEAIVRALNEPALQSQSAQANAALVAERADYSINLQRVNELYERLLRKV
jgi:glycosyltransferase involved in cell wall biosynthesis